MEHQVSAYRKILQKFGSGQADAPMRRRDALERGDSSTAKQEAHTVKGVAGNIGAVEVQASAEHLEAAVQHGADTGALITELERKLGEMVESLKSLTTAPDTAGAVTPTANTSDLISALDRPQTLLEDYDSEANDVVEGLQSQLANTDLAQPMQAIAERVDEFEFEEGLALLNAFRDTVRSCAPETITLT